MNTYVYLYTMSSYICVNPSVRPHNLSESQARADNTWQSSWVARRSSYQRSKQSNMRSGSQTGYKNDNSYLGGIIMQMNFNFQFKISRSHEMLEPGILPFGPP